MNAPSAFVGRGADGSTPGGPARIHYFLLVLVAGY